MKVKVGVSNRHIHLTEEDFNNLFDKQELSVRNYLNQPGEFASNLVVSIKGPKGIIENVRLIGPLRKYTQVEVSKTDCYKLGIDAPIRTSGDLDNAATITIINDENIITKNCCIIPKRHIHINYEEQKKYNLYDLKYKICIVNEKGAILDNVYLKLGDNYNFELHLDTDDANSNLLKTGDEVIIIKDLSEIEQNNLF